MKRTINLFLLAFYTFGTLFLPMGDFSLLKDLPEMYRHCKAKEDKDLNIFEFLTEHVSPIGQLIESVEHETEEDGDKPHEPIQSVNYGQVSVFVLTQFAFSVKQIYHIPAKEHAIQNDTFFASDYISKIFRPPIVT